MNEFYEYRRVRVAPRSWRRIAFNADAVRAAGGVFWGAFVGQIGLGANEGVVLTAWPDAAGLDKARAVVDGVGDVLESRVERFGATVRPVDTTPPDQPGVHAFRFFEIRDEHWPEFLELSKGAWPAFERDNGVQVLGFWRSLDVEPPAARVLLLTRYPSLAVWETSRGHAPNTKTDPATWERFMRRAELTDDTVVFTTTRLGS